MHNARPAITLVEISTDIGYSCSMNTDLARRIAEIITELEAAGKLVCVAHMQFVLDSLNSDGPDRGDDRKPNPGPSSHSQFMTSEQLDNVRGRS